MPISEAPAPPLLEVSGLSLGIFQEGRLIPVVDKLGFSLNAGQTLALVGESGCGKSVSALALMRLLPSAIRMTEGFVRFFGEDLSRLPESGMRACRGRKIAMIFQEPASSLDAVFTVGQHLGEALSLQGYTGKIAREKAERLLKQVGIADPVRRLDEYPFQLSGGMKQRVMIAIALAGEPSLLIADEPTTALDVTVQAQILDLLLALQSERGMAILLITHDLGIVAKMAHHVGVMYAGQLLEWAKKEDFFHAPRHPYSQALFSALPEAAKNGQRLAALPGQVPAFAKMPAACRFEERCVKAQTLCRETPPVLSLFSNTAKKGQGGGKETPQTWVRCHFPEKNRRDEQAKEGVIPVLPPEVSHKAGQEPLLEVKKLKVHFPIREGWLQRVNGYVRAVDGIDLALMPGRTLALVGESGCGKTTAGRALMRLIQTLSGEIFWRGKLLPAHDKNATRNLRRHMQMVFQDPFSSLSPRMSIQETLLEGVRALKASSSLTKKGDEGRAACAALLRQVGLEADTLGRYPHEFSGGQRQRIAIARALAVSPSALICDEPTSALDVSVQAQILNLLQDMQKELQVAYLIITHNFAVVKYLAHEIAVMYLGRIVERGEAKAVLSSPAHPYTAALLSAVPEIFEEKGSSQIIRLEGEMPSPANPPPGCHFHPRCPKARQECRELYPETQNLPGMGQRQVACHFPVFQEENPDAGVQHERFIGG